MKVIFTSICSVLQPSSFDRRFKHDLDRVKEEKTRENPEFAAIDKHDLGAFIFDWDPPAVEIMKQLCDRTGAVIVLHSSLREWYTLRQMQLLFSIHGLSSYLVAHAPILKDQGSTTAHEVEAYLKAHPEIERFVVIGAADWEFSKLFPHQFVKPHNGLEQEDFDRALLILEEGEAPALPKPDLSWAKYL